MSEIANPFGPASAACTLSYTEQTRGLAPIPAAERDLPTVTAEPYFKVSDGLVPLEGPAFDRQGNLLFVDVYGGRVLRLTPERELSTFYTDPKLHPAGIAIHKDGRVFVAGVGDFVGGSVIALDPDGGNPQAIIPPEAGYVPDDLVFDNTGGFYFTDFKGSSTRPIGGVYHVSADFETIRPVLPNMCAANGVAINQDGSVLWATEFSLGRLHRAQIDAHGHVQRYTATTPYQFIGPAPDSMRADADGNVYVAVYLQGRILAFNAFGIPIGQILLPGRENNQYLKSTSLAFFPGSRDMVIVARDEIGGGGSMIFRAQGLTQGVKMFSHM